MSCSHLLYKLVLLWLLYAGASGDDAHFIDVSADPSSWGGGWVRADHKPETAQYFHPFTAWIDGRVQRLPWLKNRLAASPDFTGNVSSYRDDLYIRVLLTGQPEFLPSF